MGQRRCRLVKFVGAQKSHYYVEFDGALGERLFYDAAYEFNYVAMSHGALPEDLAVLVANNDTFSKELWLEELWPALRRLL